VHLSAKHGIVSTTSWATQKRGTRMRRRDPEHAPARKPPGPAKGTPREYTCSRCRISIRTDRERLRNITLPYGDVEFIRRRVSWQAAKLASELHCSERDVITCMRVLIENELKPPHSVVARVGNETPYNVREETVYTHAVK
jgi:hypothetical protein